MINLSTGARLVEVERSGVVESVHTGHVVVLDPDGHLRYAAGEPEQPIFPRSCLKPVQAVGMLGSGLELEPDETALAASSHSGSPQQLRLIEQCLSQAGLTEADLGCPPALPLGEAERRAWLAAGRGESRLAMNCSGKHTAMLCTCLANGWTLADYLGPAHPLQRRLAEQVAELAGEPVAATAVDGCGAPLFAVSLLGLARAFARIATGGGARSQVAEAIRTYPELVGGPDRFVTRLMRSVGGLIAKDGAEGCFAAALPDGGAVAVKIDDGATRAADCAVAWALHHLGVDPDRLGGLIAAPVFGGGNPVGSVRPAPGW